MPNEYPELENCPFCGGDDIAPEVNHERDHAQSRCGGCGACGPMADQIGNYKRPAEAWNTRTAPQVKPLVWGDMEWDQDEYGCQEWGEFTGGLISLSECHTYAIYQHSDCEYMWTSGTLHNMRYSTYRPLNDPDWVPVIPWYSTPDGAREGAQAALAAHVASLLAAHVASLLA